MLFPSEEERRKISATLSEVQQTRDPEAALRATQQCPLVAAAWIALATYTTDPQEAETAYWKALYLTPFRYSCYLALSDFLGKLNEADPIAKHLRVLALWKIAFGDEVPDFVATHFEPELKKTAWEPETYETLAETLGIALQKNIPARLRPYYWLNDLQRQAPDEVDPATVERILGHRAECEPLLRSGLRDWGWDEDHVDEKTFCMILALIGEISGPDAFEDLFPLSTWNEKEIRLHANWAIWRLHDRHPAAVRDLLHAAVKDANVTRRCAIAEHINLGDPMPGDTDVLLSLVNDIEAIRDDEDAPILVATVIHCLMQRRQRARAEQLETDARHWFPSSKLADIRLALRGDLVPLLEQEETSELSLDDVCVGRAYMDEEMEEDEDFPEEELDEEDLAPVEPPGRNEPCWCGSGKKYKKCHMESDEVGQRAMDSGGHQDLMLRIQDAARAWHSDSDIRRAKKYYFGDSGPVDVTPDEFNGFMEYLLRDFRDAATKRTAIENFLRTRADELTEPEREELESSIAGPYGLFEVERVEPGSGVYVHDIFSGDRMFVHDITSSNQLHRWDCSLTRVQFLHGRWVFSGNGSLVPRNLLDSVRDLVERESRKAKQTPADWVKASSHRLHRDVRAIWEKEIRELRIVNREGEEVAFGTAEYDVSEPDSLMERLKSSEEILPEPDDAGFAWAPAMGTERRPMGHLEINGNILKLEAMSKTRLQTLRGLVETVGAGLVKHWGDHYLSMDQFKEDYLKNAGRRPEPEKAASAEERAVVEQMLAKHYETWADEPLPALGGKTARQAIRTKAGKQAVVDLLHLMENGEARKRNAGEPSFDFNTIRRDLGLPDE